MGSAVIGSAFRGIPWISGVQPQPVAHCVCTPHDGRTNPWLLGLRNSYERSFESPEGVREPSGGRRLATAVVVRHGRCKASSRQWDLSAAESHSSSETADPEESTQSEVARIPVGTIHQEAHRMDRSPKKPPWNTVPRGLDQLKGL